MAHDKLQIFISHSSLDVEFVKALATLLRTSLRLSATDIRCTSVDGYRLTAGANTDVQLRTEVHSAEAFIGVISTDSLKSIYVVFELGARWGASKQLIPLLTPGAEPGILGGPLSGLNALSGSNRAQMNQLITDLGKHLAITPEAAATYAEQIDAMIAIKRPDNPTKNIARASAQVDPLSEPEIKLLLSISRGKDYAYDEEHMSVVLGENLTKTRYYIDRLERKRLIRARYVSGRPETYALTESGRAYLVEGGYV